MMAIFAIFLAASFLLLVLTTFGRNIFTFILFVALFRIHTFSLFGLDEHLPFCACINLIVPQKIHPLTLYSISLLKKTTSSENSFILFAIFFYKEIPRATIMDIIF